MRLIFLCFLESFCLQPLLLRTRDFGNTNFPKRILQKTSLESWLEIRSGGVGKDGIPALDHVEMIAVAEANIPASRTCDHT